MILNSFLASVCLLHTDSQTYLKCLNGVHRAIISMFALQERPSWIACISGLKTLECEPSAVLQALDL